ncbi:MAG: MNIO family bufferin maturase [Alphaproteobacteria bacterium]
MAHEIEFAKYPIPALAGVGLKPVHFDDILGDNKGENAAVAWFEVHAENYMGAGGPPHHYLSRIRDKYPLSVHGVGLSIGGDAPLDEAHLDRLKTVVDRYQPGLVSEHLAWSSHNAGFLNDLLPLPYTDETLARVCEHIDQVQSYLGRQILLENPSTYVVFETSTMTEIDFIKLIAQRTGCGLLLDVNNVFISATNHETDAHAFIAAFPLDAVGEVHLAGHTKDTDDAGKPLLIDSHDRPIVDDVWALYTYTLDLIGPKPTLIEWDGDVPTWPVLRGQAEQAHQLLQDCRQNHQPATTHETRAHVVHGVHGVHGARA